MSLLSCITACFFLRLAAIPPVFKPADDTLRVKMEMSSEQKKYSASLLYAGMVLFVFALVLIDQFTKHLAVIYLKNQPPAVLIPGILQLQYLENRGAAFSMLQNRQGFFYVLTTVFLILIILFMRKVPKTRRMRPLILTLLVLAAGACGNLIDRVVSKYVVDFIYFVVIDFPVFNVADIYVTLSVISLIILILFHYRDNDLDFLKKKKAA